jgi:hypothetical protein
MSINGHPFVRTLFIINLLLNHLEDILITFLGMGDDATGTILDTILKRERTVAFEQIERTPAEQTGLPFFEVMAGIERALCVGEILVVHLNNSSLGNFLDGSG